MRSPASTALILFTAICLGLVSHSRAEDWPQFGRNGTRNAVSPEKNAPTWWDVGLVNDVGRIIRRPENIKWSAELGTTTYSDPVIVDGLVWIGTNQTDAKSDASVLACFRESDGKPLYRYVSPRLSQSRVHDWPMSSMACSPLVEKDRLWFVTNRAEVVCLDIGPLHRRTGEPTVVWKVDLIGKFDVYPRGSMMTYAHLCSIAGYKDFIYVNTGNGAGEGGADVPKPDAPSLICFRKATGETVWTDASPGANILYGQWSSPTVIEVGGRAQCVAAQGDGWIRSFDAQSGELIWRFDMNRKDAIWTLGGRGLRCDVLASPVFYDNRIYIASGEHPVFAEGPGRLVCLDPTRRGDMSAELAVDEAGNVLSHRRKQAVDAARGEKAVANPNSGLIWDFSQSGKEFEKMMHRTVSNVAAYNGLLIAVDLSGLLHCLDAKTGKHHWSWDLFSSVFNSPLILDGKVYVTDQEGKVTILVLSSDRSQALANVDVAGAPLAEIFMDDYIQCSPVFANGVLYVATRSRLYAIATDGRLSIPSSPGAEPPRAADNEKRSPAKAAFTATPHDVVDEMLKLAKVKKTDVVCDLG